MENETDETMDARRHPRYLRFDDAGDIDRDFIQKWVGVMKKNDLSVITKSRFSNIMNNLDSMVCILR